MNSWNRPCDYRLTVSRAKRFSRRKPVKSRHPITNACCRKMTGERGKFVARSSREKKTLDDVENNFSKVTRPSALFNFFSADSASFSYFYPLPGSIHPLWLVLAILRYRSQQQIGDPVYNNARADENVHNTDWGLREFISVRLLEHTNPKTENRTGLPAG